MYFKSIINLSRYLFENLESKYLLKMVKSGVNLYSPSAPLNQKPILRLFLYACSVCNRFIFALICPLEFSSLGAIFPYICDSIKS